MASFAEYTKKKKKKSAEGMSFTDYTKTVLGKDDIEAPISKVTTITTEDIAPVKTNEERTWFNKSEGGFWKTVGGTIADVGENLVKGIAEIPEKLLDAGAWLGSVINKGTMDQAAQDQMIFNALTGNKENAESILERNQKIQDDVEKETAKFVAEDIIKTDNIDFGVDKYSVLGEKSDSLIQSGAQLLADLGVNYLLPGSGLAMAGVRAFGGEVESATQQGATFDEATLSATISAGAEMLTEKFSGGISFGGKTLDSALMEELARGISNKTVQTLAKFGVDAFVEGYEEIFSGVMGAIGQKLTYADDKELSELFSSEEAFESFIGGFVLGGGAGGINLIKSSKSGVDYASGLHNNEKAVIDKIYNDTIAEAEADGNRLTQREKTKIYDDILQEMEKGYISTDTIEEVLGGETFKTYQDTLTNEESLQNEFNELNQMKQGEMTGEQIDRRNELKEQLTELKENSNKDNLKTQLSDEVFELVKDTKLAESYNEKSRRGQAFEADLTQYEEKYQGTIKNAVESGILNNTRRTHELVDFISKISADKGVLFDFADNEKIKNSGYAVDGKTVNGYVDKNGNVVLNVNSAKALNSTAGHEITHILEGTELYQPLADMITEYAKTKGEYDSRIEALNKLYEGVYQGEDFADKVNKELVADLVGDYVFTDKAFVQKLSTENRNIFQKIYDEIKYLCKVATAGSKEARELEKVKKTFAEVYRESGNTNKSAQTDTNTSYSLSADSEGTELSKEQQDFFKESKMRDDNGNLKVMYHGSEYAGFHEFNEKFSDDDTSFFFVDRNEVAESYSGSSEVYTAKSIRTIEDFNNFLVEIDETDDYKATEENGKYILWQDGDKVAETETAAGLYDEFCDWTGLGQGQANYKVYLNLTNPLTIDAEGRNWNRISGEFSQEVYDRYQTLTDEEKTALTQLASWEDSSVFRDELETAVESVERNANYVDDYIKNLASAAEKLGDADKYRLFDIATDNFSEESLRENAVKYLNTRDYAQRAKEQGYDGVILKNIVDNGGYSNGKEGASTVAIAFDSKQIKSVANDKPTTDPDIRYSIAGEYSNTSDISLLRKAENLVSTGADSETVRKETGWFKGYDGQWRYEIDDSKSELIENPNLEKHEDNGTYFTGKLSDILKHSELYEAYPQLRDINIVIQTTDTGISGIYQPNSNYITLDINLFKRNTNEYTEYLNSRTPEIKRIEQTPEYKEHNKWYEDEELVNMDPEKWLEEEKKARDKFYSSELGKKYYQLKWGTPPMNTTEFGWNKNAKSVLMHEIQHAIQQIEGFAKGSSERYWKSKRQDIVDTLRGARANLDLWLEDIGYSEFAKNSMQEVVNKEKTIEQHWEDCKEFKANSKYSEQIANCEAEIAEFQRQYDEITNGMTVSEQYENTAGEIEARDTANRLNLNAEQRRNKRPDIDRENVVFADKDIRYSLTEYTEEEKKAHNKAAVDYFGKTYSWNETGYLLLDGTKLDLSGKHEGAPGGYRSVDHRDISEALEEDYGGEDYSGALVQFMAEGNIRIIPEINGINLSIKPTSQQARALTEYISRARGEVVLDIDDTNGYTVQSAEYPYGTHSSKVLSDINAWFDNGKELPRYSLSKKGEALTKHGNFNIYGKDVALDIAPAKEIVEESAPITEEEANAQAIEILESLTDEDAPLEVEEPYTEYSDTTSLDKETTKKIAKALKDVLFLNRNEAKIVEEIAQKYSTSEMPDKAELFWEVKERLGEKYFIVRNEDIAEVKNYLKKYRIKVPDSIKSDIADYNTFRKSLFGKFTVAKDGLDVDTAYQELSEMFPGYFPADIINPTDQLFQMANVGAMKINEPMSEPLDDATIQEAVDIITEEVSSYKETSARIFAEDMAKEFLEDIAPLRAEQIIRRTPKTPEPIDTTEYRQAKKLQSLETELADNQQLRSEAVSDYQNRIDRLTDEYVALKDKNSRKANDIVRKIIRLERLKENVDADYSKRISGLETRVAEMKQNVKTDRVANVLVEEPTVEEKKKGGLWNSFVSNFGDKGKVFENLALKTKNRKLQAKYNFLHYSEGIAQRLIGKGTKGVKALNDIKAEVENTGKTEDFYKYLYHKHNIDRMNLEDRYDDVENKPVFGDYVTSEVSQGIANKIEAENPNFKAYAEDVYTYMNYLRNQLVEKGVISQETADLWAEMYPHYVPIRRVGDNGVNINVALDTNKTGVNAPIKKATGGNSDILPLFDTMAMRTMQTFKAAGKNNFGVELKNTLGKTIETAKTDIDEIIEGIDSHEELLQEGKNGQPPTFTVFENGERVTFEITEEMYDALKPTNKHLAKTIKPLNVMSNLQRNVLTQYNPTFMLTNALKDAQDVLMNSQHPAKTYANIPQAVVEMIGNGKYYAEYLENGGEQNTYFEKDTNSFAKEKSTLRKIVGFPLDMIANANDFIEKIPRLAEYIASRKSGASVEVAMLDSARVTTNFAAGGDVTKFANRNGFTFLNASVQGAMQQVRNVREAKANGLKGWVGLATKTIIAGLPALLLNGLLWEDDEEYEELSDYVKDNYYVVAKTEDGKFIRIPKGRAVAVIQDAFEQIGNAITGDDEVDFANFFKLVRDNLAPNNPFDNNIVAPILQVGANKTWFDEDLVPTRLQDVPQAEQYDESTDALSKWLGENLNYSPYKINYLLNQYSGGVGDVLLPMGTPEAESGDNSFSGNIIAPLKDKFTTDSIMNNQNVSDFYNKVDELTVNANSSSATDEDILKSKYMNSVNTELSDLYKQKREIQNSDLADNVKYNKVRNIQDQINTLARNSLNSYENVNIQGTYATVGDLQYRWYEPGEDSSAEAGWQKITDKQLEKQEKVTSGLGISAPEYWRNKEEYDYAYEYPENYAVAKSVGGYNSYKTYTGELYDIKADKDENGKSISGSRKEKVADYINNLDIDYYEKIILFKNEYNADDTYNEEIIDYLNNREDISAEEMELILKKLGFTVKANGKIEW